jgi:hypothetical protein
MGIRRRGEDSSANSMAPRATTRLLGFAAAMVIVLSWLAAGCVERRSPEEPEIAAHTPEFNEELSLDFHGARVLERGASSCMVCHGHDFQGASGVPSCYECHDGAGGHPYGWEERGASSFHGAAVEATGPAPCAACHGEDYAGGWSGVSCSECHAGGPSGHPAGWLESHGQSQNTTCARCHGIYPGSGSSGLSCGDCHD